MIDQRASRAYGVAATMLDGALYALEHTLYRYSRSHCHHARVARAVAMDLRNARNQLSALRRSTAEPPEEEGNIVRGW